MCVVIDYVCTGKSLGEEGRAEWGEGVVDDEMEMERRERERKEGGSFQGSAQKTKKMTSINPANKVRVNLLSPGHDKPHEQQRVLIGMVTCASTCSEITAPILGFTPLRPLQELDQGATLP
jgi:hypothetical protein